MAFTSKRVYIMQFCFRVEESKYSGDKDQGGSFCFCVCPLSPRSEGTGKKAVE